MIDYLLNFASSLFLEMFGNELLEILPLIFLFAISLKILNMIKKVV